MLLGFGLFFWILHIWNCFRFLYAFVLFALGYFYLVLFSIFFISDVLLAIRASRSVSAVTVALMEAPIRTPVLHPVCARYQHENIDIHTDECSVWTSPAASLVPHLGLRIFPLHLFSHLSCLQENVEGENCDRCKMGFYNLERDNQRGCEKCSCMGVSSHCTESTWTYQNVGNNSEK